MFFYDPKVNYTLFSSGKCGTSGLYDQFTKLYDTINYKPEIDQSLFTYDPKGNHTHIPLYSLSPNGYVRIRKDINKQINYIIIRDPTDRLLSGLMQNLYLFYQTLDLDNVDQSIYSTQSSNHYHIGEFLSAFDSAILKNSTFVLLSDLSKFQQFLFNSPPVCNNRSLDKVFRAQNYKIISNKVIYNYFAEQVRKKKIPKEIQDLLKLENKAYRKILQASTIWR